MMKNPDLLKEIIPTESELKEVIVNYVGNTLQPENWVNGYTQALNDVKYTQGENYESKELYKK